MRSARASRPRARYAALEQAAVAMVDPVAEDVEVLVVAVDG